MFLKRGTLGLAATLCLLFLVRPAAAVKVTVDLGDAKGVTSVGALDRWDEDGNHRAPSLPGIVLAVLAAALVMAVLAAFIPVRRVAGIDPAAVFRA